MGSINSHFMLDNWRQNPLTAKTNHLFVANIYKLFHPPPIFTIFNAHSCRHQHASSRPRHVETERAPSPRKRKHLLLTSLLAETEHAPSLLFGQLFYSFFNPKSLQQPSKCSLYFKKVSLRSQIYDFWAILQSVDIQRVDTFGQDIEPWIRWK